MLIISWKLGSNFKFDPKLEQISCGIRSVLSFRVIKSAIIVFLVCFSVLYQVDYEVQK